MATWNKNEPSGDVLGSAIPSYIRELKDYFEDAFGREHSFPPDGSSDGQHKVDEIAPCQVVEESSSLDKSKNLYKLKYSPFKNLGRKNPNSTNKIRRSGFNNFK